MIRIELDELGAWIDAPITAAQATALVAANVVEATPSLSGATTWQIRPTGKVGVAQVGDVEVWIRPKVSINRLLFLVGYATNPRGWRDETVTLTADDDLLPALAHALYRQCEHALLHGLLQGYRPTEEAAPVLRGRLREADQLRRRHGQLLPVEISYDDFTADIAENQILRAATDRLLRLARIDTQSRHRLRHLLSRLATVDRLIAGQALPIWRPTRLNSRYHTALRLAELILRHTSVEHAAGTVAVNGFLLDMPRIFEDFVTVALGQELRRRHGGRTQRQDLHHLDHHARLRLRPDLVWHHNGRPAAVIDAKYKAAKPAGFPEADLYQMLAYCTALRLPQGHLIYAQGNEQPAHYHLRHCDIQIICHTLDLAEPPAELLAQINRIAHTIASTA